MADLQTASPFLLLLAGSIQVKSYDLAKVECRAHAILHSSRLTGEWFSCSSSEAMSAVQRAATEILNERTLNAHYPVPVSPDLASITSAQCRAARALLDWNQDALAQASKVGLNTLRNFESGKSAPMTNNLAAIQGALEAVGVQFIPENGGGAGVWMKSKAAPSS